MAGYLSNNLRFLVGKLETTAGTMETLTADDFNVQVRNPELTLNVEVDDENSKWARGDHGEDHSIQGVQTATTNFAVRCVTGLPVTTEPMWSKFLKACGQKEVLYAETGYGWQPLKEYDNKTMTIWVYDVQQGATPSAVVYKLKGCMGNVTIGADGVGKPWLAAFAFQGVVDSVVDVTTADILVPAHMDTNCADKMLSNVAYVGTVPEKISSFSLDAGNELNPVYDQSSSAGIAYYTITARHPRLSMNPLAQLVATRDVWSELTSGVTGCPTTQAIGIGDTGISTKFWIQVPKAQTLSSALANREGLVSWDQNFKLLANGETGALTDDDFSTETTFEVLQGTRS